MLLAGFDLFKFYVFTFFRSYCLILFCSRLFCVGSKLSIALVLLFKPLMQLLFHLAELLPKPADIPVGRYDEIHDEPVDQDDQNNLGNKLQ